MLYDCEPPFERLEPSNRSSITVKGSFVTVIKPRVFKLLFIDGFEAYEDLNILQYYKAFNIILFTLPAYISYILQPLDVGVYQVVKKAY